MKCVLHFIKENAPNIYAEWAEHALFYNCRQPTQNDVTKEHAARAAQANDTLNVWHLYYSSTRNISDISAKANQSSHMEPSFLIFILRWTVYVLVSCWPSPQWQSLWHECVSVHSTHYGWLFAQGPPLAFHDDVALYQLRVRASNFHSPCAQKHSLSSGT